MTARSLIQLGLVAAFAAVTGLAFQPVYADGNFGSTVVTSAVAAVGLWIVVAIQAPKHQGLSMIVSAVGLLFLLANTVLADTAWLVFPTPSTVQDLFSGLINGWDRLLTTDIPVAGTTSLLVIPPTLVWIASFASADLAMRTRAALSPIVPGLIVFTIGTFFAGADSGDRPLNTALVILLALSLVLVRRQRPAGLITDVDPVEDAGRTGRLIVEVDEIEVHRATARPRARALALGIGLVVVAAVLAPLAGSNLPFASAREPYNPRADLDDDPEEREDLSPLVLMKTLLTQEPEELFTVRANGRPQNLRLVVLDDFDGEQWHSQGVYQNAGTELPEPTLPGPDNTVDLVEEIDIDHLDGPWLPAVSRPTSVSADDDFQPQVEPESGSLVVEADDVDGLSYTVTSEVTSATGDELRAAALSTDPALQRYTELPAPTGEEPAAVFREIQEEALRVTGAGESPYARMRQLESYFRNNDFDSNNEVAPGHSYGHLQHFLDVRQGSAEQFAAAFVVMARAAGFPARLAVGFVPGEQGDDGLLHVLSDDAHAWPEVYFEGLGWVSFEPNPERAALDDSEVAQAEAPARPENETTEDGSQQTAAEREAAAREREETTRRIVLTAAVVVGALLLLLVVGIAVVRRRRRHRRRTAGSPNARVVGAYQDALDEFSLAGLHRTQRLTGAELSALADEQFGEVVARHATVVATLANEALFSGRPLDERSAQRAWDDARELRRALRSTRSTGSRIVGAFNPRPLVRRR
jgi:transglutaminase-like putative cysteine protease